MIVWINWIIIATLRFMSTISFSGKDERLHMRACRYPNRRGDGFARLPEYGLSRHLGGIFSWENITVWLQAMRGTET
jgi:hypothetical protein